jgi:hypothetical protein
MWWRALIAGGLLAGLLTACAAVDPVDNRYDNVSRSWAKARNEAIFLNLIRASYNDPLSFTTVSNVTPVTTNQTTLGLPSFLEGPGFAGVLKGATAASSSFPSSSPYRDVIFGSTTASNSTTISSNFSISTQETSAFYDGFLKPIDLQTLNYFIRQGYPRELLFWLFADSFQLQPTDSPTSAIGYHYNPPDSYGCPEHDSGHRCFREWVWIALLTGLTVEEKTIVTKLTSKYDTTPVARFCFSPDLARQAVEQMGSAFAAEIKRKYMHFASNPSPICGTWKDKDAEALLTDPQPDTFSFTVGGAIFRVVPRSAFGVFEFLGNLMKMQRDNIPPIPGKAFFWAPPRGEPDEAVVPPVLRTVDGQPPLIDVVPADQGKCFVQSWYLNNDFCVPEDATTTKQVFSLLAQLIAIQTQAGDLSITPIVRVVQ